MDDNGNSVFNTRILIMIYDEIFVRIFEFDETSTENQIIPFGYVVDKGECIWISIGDSHGDYMGSIALLQAVDPQLVVERWSVQYSLHGNLQ
jgi:hypothetical protein